MIHIFIGTKAQLIKMAPIVKELENRKLPYSYIDSGQHGALTNDLRKEFEIRKPDAFLRKEMSNIQSVQSAILWIIKSLARLILSPGQVFKEIFNGRKGICLIHGDTITTLISLAYAKRFGMPVYHIEAGLRSYNILHPFPEEIIRLFAMKFSDRLFAPSKWAFHNLCRMGYREKSIDIGANTGQDAICRVVQRNIRKIDPASPYVVVTIHRFETIFNHNRLSKVVSVLESLAGTYRLIWILHGPTKRQLQHYGLFKRVQQIPNVQILPVLPYVAFIALMHDSDFVISDGGSVQEECYYMNKPCLLMRMKTERQEGVGENVFLSEFDMNRFEYFIKNFEKFKTIRGYREESPSRIIVDDLAKSSFIDYT